MKADRRSNWCSLRVVVVSVAALVPLSLASCGGSETGASGNAGSTGTAGSGSGNAGTTGAAGTTGVGGTSGQGGRAGSPTGNAGTPGNAGSLGAAGDSGVAGTTGVAGATGNGGRGGSTGVAGTTGIAGGGGTTGTAGTSGVAGTTGGGGRGGAGAAGTTGGAGRGGTIGSGGRGGTGTGGSGAGGSGGFMPPTEPGSIAYIGCSMADNIGGGYRAVGGTIMWTNQGYATGAKVVQNWTANGDGWSLFNTKMNATGGKDKIKAIMVQICILSSRATDAELKSMIQAARDHTNPGTHIYIVGQPQYEAGHECNLAGPGGAKWTDDQAKALAADPSVNQNMTYLGQFKLNCSNNECQDACHANTAGQQSLGNQAKAFWGG